MTRLEQAEKVAREATPGPWFPLAEPLGGDVTQVSGPQSQGIAETVGYLGQPREADARFIAGARTGYPDALTVVRAAVEAEKTLSEAVRRNEATWLALEPHLSEPYPDDPRWTPWTRFAERALAYLNEATEALASVRAALAPWIKEVGE